MFQKYLDAVLKVILATLLFMIVIMVTVQVTTRYAFNNPTTWTEELVRYSFVWMVMLGAVLALVRKRHLYLDILTDRMKGKFRQFHELGVKVITLAYFLAIAYGGWLILPRVAKQMSPSLGISMSIPYGAIFCGMVLLSAVQILHIVEDITAIRKKER